MRMERPSSPSKIVEKCAKYHNISLSDAADIVIGNAIHMDRQIIGKLVEFIKPEYADNKIQLEIINDFSTTFHDALRWYASGTFVHQILNKALREQNIDIIILFRPFIKFLHSNLEKNRKNILESSMRLYRGQAMSTKELNFLKKRKILSMNSYLSTSRNKDVALAFARSIPVSKQLQAVLFEIYIENTKQYDTKAFADISNLSQFREESEILFDLGTIFEINDIEYNHYENIWNIKLKLLGQNDDKLRDVYNSVKNIFQKAVTFHSLGAFLYIKGEYDKAEKYSLEYLSTFDETTKYESAGILHNLGAITSAKGDYDKALHYYQLSIDYELISNSIDNASLAETYSGIGSICSIQAVGPNDLTLAHIYFLFAQNYLQQNNHELAREYYDKCFYIRKSQLPKDHYLLADVEIGIGLIYYKQDKLNEALKLCMNGLRIKQQLLPTDHPDFITNHSNIGHIFLALQNYELAFRHYTEAYRILKQQSAPTHHLLVALEENINYVQQQLYS
ncbi:hypothetical protein I4U23_017185 [Adineta vaga]|nr:hypothetical protein I4U23_017185 [Adineta vaga]